MLGLDGVVVTVDVLSHAPGVTGTRGVACLKPCGLAVPVMLGDVLILAEAFGDVEQVTPRLGAPRCQVVGRWAVEDDVLRT